MDLKKRIVTIEMPRNQYMRWREHQDEFGEVISTNCCISIHELVILNLLNK